MFFRIQSSPLAAWLCSLPRQSPRSCQDTSSIGVENPRGPEAVCMNIHELLTERKCLSFCLVPLQRARGFRYVPLAREVLRPRTPNDVMLMWERRDFAENLNGFNLGPVHLDFPTITGTRFHMDSQREESTTKRRSHHHVSAEPRDAWSRVLVPHVPAILRVGNSQMRSVSSLFYLGVQRTC